MGNLMRNTWLDMQKWSIVTKIVLMVCGIVTMLGVFGGAMLMTLEADLLKSFMQQHQQTITRTLDDRQRGEQTTLREYMEFIAQILS